MVSINQEFGAIIIAILIALLTFAILINRKRKPINFPKDIVILHQLPRAIRAPSISPFALKLETWIRMAGIKYQNDFSSFCRSPKGKVPWITYNDLTVSDSHFCIEFLKKKFDKDLSAHLSPYDKSLARAFLKMIEESWRWAGLIHRFRYGKPEDCGLPALIFKVAGRKMLKECDSQGYGRHSKEELYEIGETDLEAFEAFMTGKKFLMGDKVCNEDAAVFGQLCQGMYHTRGPIHDYLVEKCPNLKAYIERMKELYWPDWNENIREKNTFRDEKTQKL